MRFTPVTHFASGQLEPCVTAIGSGSVSSSFQVGNVNWNLYLFTSSVQQGGSPSLSPETYQFQVLDGSTTRAIVGVIGGGGSGGNNGLASTDGAGGGGGGVNIVSDVQLFEDATYTITIGHGGDRSEEATSGIRLGEDGQDSSFSQDGGSFIITATGGSGGSGSLGGASGTPLGNTTTFGNYGGNGALQASSGSEGGYGFSVYFGGGYLLRAGGGGAKEGTAASGLSAKAFGGGSGLIGQGINGAGGELRDDGSGTTAQAFGGGGGGGEYYIPANNNYVTSFGGGGAVFICVPTNLCTGSLYSPSGEYRSFLHSNYISTKLQSFGKAPYEQFVTNLVTGGQNLDHYFTYDTGSDIKSAALYANYTSSANAIIAPQSGIGSGSFAGDLDIGPNIGTNDYYSCSLDNVDVSNGFSIEWYGKPPNSTAYIAWALTDGIYPTDNPSVKFYKDYIDLYDDVGAKTTINATVFPSGLSHHVVTYGGGTIKWYINGTLDTTTTYTISNNLDNPELQIGEPNTPGNSDQYNRVFRVYTTDLNSTQVTQNYNAATS